ncbi:MAG: acetyl-CoA carboxylase biotin carboxyl carrier protein subunit [Bacteroidales bacterium]|jgi:biotin carboxyl carrier protein|nr:acetyl-CoA carboxylase biotin carboxyl carrier protein subunit [Bacteroidales bacterium]
MNTDKLGRLNIDSTHYTTRISRKYAERAHFKKANPKHILSFIPGTVLDILVKPGQKVSRGEHLMILEAMKMQNLLKAATDGTVKKISVKKGDKVAKGSVLIVLE